MKHKPQSIEAFHPGSAETALPGLRNCSLCPNRANCPNSPDVAWLSETTGRDNVPPPPPIPSAPGN